MIFSHLYYLIRFLDIYTKVFKINNIATGNITVTDVAVVNRIIRSAALPLFIEAEEQYKEIMREKGLEQEEGQVLGENVLYSLALYVFLVI